MFKTLLITLALSFPAHAKMECYRLLSAPADLPAGSSDILPAAEWIQSRLHGRPPNGFGLFLAEHGQSLVNLNEIEREVWLGQFTLVEWKHLSQINHPQRMAALAVELRKLSPGPERATPSFDGESELNALSAANLQRLLARLDELYPPGEVPAEHLLPLTEKWQGLQFHRLRNVQVTTPISSSPPILSPREFSRLGLQDPDIDYYSALVGESQSVPFQIIATDTHYGTYNLGSMISRNSIRLDDSFARANGFYLPELNGTLDLIKLLEKWAPEALEEQLHSMRFDLPEKVKTVAQMRRYLTPNRVSAVFPELELFKNAGVLRRALKGFVLNDEDGKTFLRAAFLRFLEEESKDTYAFNDLMGSWDKPGGAQRIFGAEFLEFLGWSGVQFRVPISVAATDYSVVRKQAHPNRGPRYGQERQKPWDSRRLDHGLKP
ncbi:MAG: hypothetical protein KF799_11160 [Bdellovibrionales bacterium]|nr:hypothetical protein [Bdellovibrionales bacterium]